MLVGQAVLSYWSNSQNNVLINNSSNHLAYLNFNTILSSLGNLLYAIMHIF